MKYRTLALLSAFCLLIASATPTSAFFFGGMVMNHDEAVIANDITTTAITGMNLQGNTIMVNKAGADDLGVKGANSLSTGMAVAETKLITAANVDVGCGCMSFFHPSMTFDSDNAVISNTVLTQVDTGDNNQGNGVSVEKAHVDDIAVEGNNTLVTGKAIAKTGSIVVVNTQWSGMMIH